MRAIRLTTTTISISIAAIALAGACDKPIERLPGAAGPAVEKTSPSIAATASPTTSPSATVAPSATRSSTPTSPISTISPCPVSAATLHNDLKRRVNTQFFLDSGKPIGMTEVSCYRGYAFGRTVLQPPIQGEIPYLLFKFEAANKRWVAISIGTGGICEGHVPEDVLRNLKGC